MPALLNKLQKQWYRWRRKVHQQRQQQCQQHQQNQQQQQQQKKQKQKHFNLSVTTLTQAETQQKHHHLHQHHHYRYHYHWQHWCHYQYKYNRHQQHLKQRLKRKRQQRFSQYQNFFNLSILANCNCARGHKSSKIFNISTTSPTRTATSTRRLYAAIFTLMLSIVCHYTNALQPATSPATVTRVAVSTASFQLVRDFERMPQNKPQQLSNGNNTISTKNNQSNKHNSSNNFGYDINGNVEDGKNYGKSNFSVALEKYYKTIENLTDHFKSFSIADLHRSESETIVDADLQHVDSQPIFDFGMPRNITGRTGHTEAVIKCRVDMLNDKSVSWIRKRDLHILTVGTTTYTTDKRFEVTVSKDEREWTLHVKSPQERDTGIYECQINTEPKISMAFQLNVIEIAADAKAKISGPPDLHFKVGSAIVLQCLVEQPTVKDIGPIYWYRGEQMITPFQHDDNNNGDHADVGASDNGYSSLHLDSGSTSVTASAATAALASAVALDNANSFVVEDMRTMHDLTNDITPDFTARIVMESQLGDTLKSRLRISNAQKTDTGNYTCQPTTASSASVMVHVINDENPAAMQKSVAVALTAQTASVFAIVCFCLAFLLACRRVNLQIPKLDVTLKLDSAVL